MKNQTPVKLSEISKNLKLWRGTKFRLILDDPYGEDKYWDYMLIYLPEDPNYMVLANVTSNSPKAGAVFRERVEIDHSENSAVVTKAALKKAFGPDFENCYLISWDE